jgi:hypothetical protein
VVQLLARNQVRSCHVEAENGDVLAADARGYSERPKGYGVEVIPGAFTLWNQHVDRGVTMTADLTGLTAAASLSPVEAILEVGWPRAAWKPALSAATAGSR